MPGLVVECGWWLCGVEGELQVHGGRSADAPATHQEPAAPACLELTNYPKCAILKTAKCLVSPLCSSNRLTTRYKL